MLTCIRMQNIFKMHHLVQELWVFSLTAKGRTEGRTDGFTQRTDRRTHTVIIAHTCGSCNLYKRDSNCSSGSDLFHSLVVFLKYSFEKKKKKKKKKKQSKRQLNYPACIFRAFRIPVIIYFERSQKSPI